eukprot:scaffold9921_cov112-Isochrysis_galbana.AAC.2
MPLRNPRRVESVDGADNVCSHGLFQLLMRNIESLPVCRHADDGVCRVSIKSLSETVQPQFERHGRHASDGQGEHHLAKAGTISKATESSANL